MSNKVKPRQKRKPKHKKSDIREPKLKQPYKRKNNGSKQRFED